MKKPETTELECVEVCDTQWTSQWTDIQNNIGEKTKMKTSQQKTQSKTFTRYNAIIRFPSVTNLSSRLNFCA